MYEKLRRTPEDSDYKGGEKICDADVRQAEEVRADAEDEDTADVAEVLERGGGHDRLDRAGGEEDRPLEDADRERGENAAPPECRSEQHDDDAVEDALGEEDGRVGKQAVAHRADDGHRADAEGQRRADKPVDEMRIAAAARDAFQPRAECCHAVLNVEDFADDCTADETGEHHVDADEDEVSVCADPEHLAQRSAETEEQHRERAGTHDGILKPLRDEAAASQPQDASQCDSGNIRKNSDPRHDLHNLSLSVLIRWLIVLHFDARVK